jgi:hypothetical protein
VKPVGETGDEDAFATFHQLLDKSGEGVSFSGARGSLDEVEGTGGESYRDGVGLGFVAGMITFEEIHRQIVDLYVDGVFLIIEEDGVDVFSSVAFFAERGDGAEVEGGEIDQVLVEGPAVFLTRGEFSMAMAMNGEAVVGEAEKGGAEEVAIGVVLVQSEGLLALEDGEVFARRGEMDEAFLGVDGGNGEVPQRATELDPIGKRFGPKLAHVLAL